MASENTTHNKEANKVFLAMMGMPSVPNIYALFSEQYRAFRTSMGWVTYRPPVIWTEPGKLRLHINHLVNLNLPNVARQPGQSRSQRAKYKRELVAQNIPEDWWIVNLMTHEVWKAKEFYPRHIHSRRAVDGTGDTDQKV